MERRRIAQVNVVVDDVAPVTEVLIGLGVAVDDLGPAFSAWSAHHRNVTPSGPVEIDVDSTAFARHWGSLPSGFTGAVINVEAADRDDVDSLFDRAVELGAAPQREPYDAFWGSRFALVTVGAVAIGFRSEPDADRRSVGPDPSDL